MFKYFIISLCEIIIIFCFLISILFFLFLDSDDILYESISISLFIIDKELHKSSIDIFFILSKISDFIFLKLSSITNNEILGNSFLKYNKQSV